MEDPATFNKQRMNVISNDIDVQIRAAGVGAAKCELIEKDLIEKIEQLKNLFKDNEESNYLQQLADDLMKQIRKDQENIGKTMNDVPSEIDILK